MSAPKKTTVSKLEIKGVSGRATSRSKLPSNEIDNSSFRLSRPPSSIYDRLTQQNKFEPYSVRYFNAHPEEIDDIETPEAKLVKIENELSNGVDEDKKFQLLMKQKCLNYLIYGENSIQSLLSHLEIGELYLKTNRIESSLRHLEKSYKQSCEYKSDDELFVRIRLSYSEAIFASSSTKKSISNVSKLLKECESINIQESFHQFKKHYLEGIVYFYKGQNEESYHSLVSALRITQDHTLDFDAVSFIEYFHKVAKNSGHIEESDELINNIKSNCTEEEIEAIEAILQMPKNG